MRNNPKKLSVLAMLIISTSIPLLEALTGTVGGEWVSPSQTPHSGEGSPGENPKESSGRAPLIGTVEVRTLPRSERQSGPILSPLLSSDEAEASHPGLVLGRGNLSTTSSTVVGVSTVFSGVNATQNCCVSPPDVQVAVGPDHIVEMVNVQGAVFTKKGAPVSLFSLSGFFNVSESTRLADPKVLFDLSSQRWFASIIAFVQNAGGFTESRVLVAVSATSDPTAIWNLYSLTGAFGVGPNPVSGIPDQPIIGFSDDKFIVSVNDFALTNAGRVRFIGTQYWVLNKAELTRGESSVHYATYGPDRTLFSVHPVKPLSSTKTAYMVTVGASTRIGCVACRPRILSITGVPPGNITIETAPLDITPILAPPPGVQPSPDEGNLVNTGDSRVLDTAWFQSKLWFTLNDGCIPHGDHQIRSCFRLVQVDTRTMNVKQDFDHGSIESYYFYPALSIDSSGNLVVAYGYSSPTTNPSLAVTGQLFTDPANSLASPSTLVLGSAPEDSGRYGDYFGAGLDPSDKTRIWVAGQYIADPSGSCGFNCWSTLIASVGLVGFGVQTSPAFATVQADTSLSATITITSVNSFSGVVSFSTYMTPSGPTATISPSTVRLRNGESISAILTVSTGKAVPGTYFISVDATSSQLIRSAALRIIVPSFFVSANPASARIPAGSSSSLSKIAVESSNGFIGSVELFTSISPTEGLSCSLTPNMLLVGASAKSTLHCTSTNSGIYTVTVTATGGVVSRSTSLTVIATPLSVTAEPAVVIVQSGSVASTKLTLTSLAGFSGIVNITAKVSPVGPVISLSQTSVYLDTGGTGSLMMTVSAPPVSAENYTVTVTGTTGIFAFPTNMIVKVTDFRLIHPGPVVTFPGESGRFSVPVRGLNGFNGTVTLSLLPFSSAPNCSLDPNEVTLGTSASTVVTCPSTPASFSVQIRGESGSLSRSIRVTVYLVDIAIFTDSDTVSIPEGSSAQVKLNLQVSSFDGRLDATLSAEGLPLGAAASFSPNPVLILPITPKSSTLTIVLDGVAPGTYDFNLTATISRLTRHLPLSLRVLPAKLDFAQTASFQGATLTFSSVFAVRRTDSRLELIGTTSFTASNATTQTLIISGALTMILPMGPENDAFYVVELPTSPFRMSLGCKIDAPGIVATCSITRTPDIDRDGIIDGDDILLVTDAVGCSEGDFCYTPLVDVDSNGTVDEADVAVVHLYQGAALFPPPTFTISSETGSMSFIIGSTGATTIGVVGLNGFAGTVNLFLSSSTGLDCLLSSTSVVLGDARTVSLNCTAVNSGVYDATVTGSSGTVTYSTSITVVVSPFNISSSSEHVTVQVGSSEDISLTLTSLAGFSGIVSLSSSVSPEGPTISLGQPVVHLEPNSTSSLNVRVSATSSSAGNYTITLTGSVASLFYAKTISVRVTDFRLSSLIPQIIPAGFSYSQTVRVTSLNGFSGTVAFSTSVSPSGFNCSISPVVATPNAQVSSTLTCTLASSEGSYRVQVAGIAGSLTRVVSADVHVFDFAVGRTQDSLTVGRESFESTTLTVRPSAQYLVFAPVVLTPTGPPGVSFIFSEVLAANTFGGGVAWNLFPSQTEPIRLTVIVDSSVPVGTHKINVTGAAAGLTRSVLMDIIVPDFGISLDPTPLTFRTNLTGAATVTVASINGFDGIVVLTPVASRPGLDCKLDPAELTLEGTKSLSTLLCTGAVGTYFLTVTVASPSLSHSLVMRVIVTR